MKRNEKGQFVKGSKMTAEEKIVQARRMSEAWVDRKDYIADKVNEYPRIYNSWRGIRFTEKGKKAGCCSAWSDFKTFFEDVISTYRKGLVLRRKDIYKPFGPDNFMWISSSEVGLIRENIRLAYNGKNLLLSEWSRELSCPVSAIRQRYHKHKDDWSIHDILYGKRKKRKTKAVKDIPNSRNDIRSKASKMISSYRIKDIKWGVPVCDIDIDWMIENIMTKPCIYCGDTHRIGCDRIDNDKGHTKDNVVPCCIECNTARNDYFTFAEMRKLGRTIAEIKEQRNNQSR